MSRDYAKKCGKLCIQKVCNTFNALFIISDAFPPPMYLARPLYLKGDTMPAFLLTFLSMISGSLGPIGQWIKGKQELQLLQQETTRQVALQQLKMATEGVKEDGVAANTRLKSTGRYFKYITFVMWFIPFVTCLVSPTASSVIFNNFNQMPPWYSQSCVLMMFAVWGISVSAPVVSSIFSSLGNYVADNRIHQQTMAKLNRPEFYNSLRAQRGALSEQEVAQIETALNVSE